MDDDPPKILYHPKRVLTFFLLAIVPLFSFFVIYPVVIQTDVRRGFAHKNGRSQEEFARFAEHFGISYEGLELWVVLITAKGGGTLTISQKVLDEVARLDDHLRNFTMVTERGEVIESAPLFGGDINHLFKWMSSGLNEEDLLAEVGDETEKKAIDKEEEERLLGENTDGTTVLDEAAAALLSGAKGGDPVSSRKTRSKSRDLELSKKPMDAVKRIRVKVETLRERLMKREEDKGVSRNGRDEFAGIFDEESKGIEANLKLIEGEYVISSTKANKEINKWKKQCEGETDKMRVWEDSLATAVDGTDFNSLEEMRAGYDDLSREKKEREKMESAILQELGLGSIEEMAGQIRKGNTVDVCAETSNELLELVTESLGVMECEDLEEAAIEMRRLRNETREQTNVLEEVMGIVQVTEFHAIAETIQFATMAREELEKRCRELERQLARSADVVQELTEERDKAAGMVNKYEQEITARNDAVEAAEARDEAARKALAASFRGRDIRTARDRREQEVIEDLRYKQVYPLAAFSSGINLTYPVARINEHRLLVASHFFGVNENGTERDAPIETARTMGLWYISNAPGLEKRKQLEEIEMDAFKLALNDSFSEVISFEMFADQVANAEMLRGTLETQNLFIVGIVLMVLFMMFTFRHLTAKSMGIIIVGAMASPALATAATFAILGWVGATLNSIMCITPFLVMAIGVDDGFLLLHAWRRKRREVAASVIGSELTAEIRARIARCLRMANLCRSVLLDVAPSMAITSVTNTMAFGVGIFSPTPQMSDFCLATAMAILLDFFFEFLVFLPSLALFYDEKDRDEDEDQSCGGISSWEIYTSMLLSAPGKIIVAALVLALYTSSFIGLITLKTGFAPEKTFPSNSRLVQSLAAFDRIHEEYAPLNLITRKVPVAEDSASVERYREMVTKIDHRPGCYAEHTQNPVLEYMDWDRLMHNDSSPSYDRLPEYLEERMMTKLKIVRWENENGTVRLDGSNFFVVCKGLKDWSERANSVDTLRKLLDEYPEFDTSLFDYDGTIYDIVISVKEEVIKAVTITFICMAVACAIFIPSLIGASVAAFSMLSITFTMLGTLSHWGATLDPITMINILLAIGFSVDFSAHICYHFYKERSVCSTKSRARRMSEILEAVGKPIFEASLSTFICVAPLFLLKIYVFNSFAKTVMLVAILGLFHGLVIIPVILSFFLPAGVSASTSADEDPEKKRSIETASDDSNLREEEKTRLPLLTTTTTALRQ